MNNLSNNTVLTIKQLLDDVLLLFRTLINAKTWACELNLDFRNKSEWTLCHFINSDLNKEAHALEVAVLGKQNHITQKTFSTIY